MILGFLISGSARWSSKALVEGPRVSSYSFRSSVPLALCVSA